MTQDNSDLGNLFNYDVVIRAIEELISLLSNEIQYLKHNQISLMSDNYEKKNDLVQYVESIKSFLKQNPSIKERLTQQQKDNLINLAQQLHDTVLLNNEELLKAKSFNDEVIKIVIKAVKNEGSVVNLYDRNGYKGNYTKTNPPSLTLNKKI